MPNHPRLMMRGSTFWFRAMVPAAIRESYPKLEEKFSLRTKCPKEALVRVRQKSVEVDARFEAHRKGLMSSPAKTMPEITPSPAPASRLTSADIRARADQHYQSVRDGDFAWRAAFRERFNVGDYPLPDTEHLYGRMLENGATDDNVLSYCLVHERKKQFKTAYRAQQLGCSDNYEHLVNDDVTGIDRINLLGALIDAEVRALKFILRHATKMDLRSTEARHHVENDPLRMPGLQQQTASPGTAVGADAGPLVSAAGREWIAEQSREAWKPKTAAAMEAILNQFVETIDDKPIGDVTKADFRSFKATLMKLPANVTKHPVLRLLPIKDAAERAEADGLKPMSLTNVNKNVTRVASFFRWCQKNYDAVMFNPAEGMSVRERKFAKDDRHPFTIVELNKIFSAPLFHDDRIRTSAKYWVPLLGLFSGARLGELIQLHTVDIKHEDGVDFIDICLGGTGENMKSIKTESSIRQVPLHPLLIRMGFLDFVAQRKGLRLFPDYKRSPDQSWSAAFSKHFGRFLKGVDAKHSKNSYHSLRHNLEDFAKNSGVDIPRIEAIMGHAAPGMGGRYGDGFNLKALAEAVHMVRYDGVDLKHLYVTEKARENT